MNKMSMVLHQEIHKHPLNNSPAKMSFKFNKTERFKQNNPECPVAFYTYSSQLSKRKSSIGSGIKSDFTKDLANTPGSSHYNPDFYYNSTKQGGKSFGQSRQLLADRSYLIPQIHKHPGPGTYQTEKEKKRSSSYTMRAKTIDLSGLCIKPSDAPGPGAYEAVDLNPKNTKAKVSKYKGPKLGVTMTSARFNDPKDAPGPLTYQQIDNFSPTSKYVTSQHRGRGTRPFSQQKRFTHYYWKTNENPSPNHYDKPSQFGVYGSTMYYQGVSTIN